MKREKPKLEIPKQMIVSGIIWGRPYIMQVYGIKSNRSLNKLIEEGFPCSKIGGRWCIRKELADAWFDKRLHNDNVYSK